MKKIIITIVFIGIFSIKICAQEFKGGLLGGVNASWLSNVSTVELWYKWYRFQGGLYVNYLISKQNFIKAEIKYIQRGNHVFPDLNGDYAVKLHYAEIPFLFGYFLKKNKMEKIESENVFVVGGVSYAHLISAGERIGYANNSYYTDPNPSFKKHDFLANLGLGYNFNSRFCIELRFSASILPVRNHDDLNIYMVGSQSNRTVSLITNFQL